jgi:hypothetical protein
MKISKTVEWLILIILSVFAWGGSFAVVIMSIFFNNNSFWFAFIWFVLFWVWLLGGIYMRDSVMKKIKEYNNKIR